jgi:hypothetical protein
VNTPTPCLASHCHMPTLFTCTGSHHYCLLVCTEADSPRCLLACLRCCWCLPCCDRSKPARPMSCAHLVSRMPFTTFWRSWTPATLSQTRPTWTSSTVVNAKPLLPSSTRSTASPLPSQMSALDLLKKSSAKQRCVVCSLKLCLVCTAS